MRAVREDYVRSVEQAGAVPVVLPPVPARGRSPRPRSPGRRAAVRRRRPRPGALRPDSPHPKLRRVDRRRDDFELALVREALRRDRPLLAICRGQQVLNVAMGGTLLQDIPSELGVVADHDAPGERTSRPHAVEVLAHTRLRAILDRDELDVNSIHHQAVDRLGDGLDGLGPIARRRSDRGPRGARIAIRRRRPVAPGVVLGPARLLPVPVRRPRGGVSLVIPLVAMSLLMAGGVRHEAIVRGAADSGDQVGEKLRGGAEEGPQDRQADRRRLLGGVVRLVRPPEPHHLRRPGRRAQGAGLRRRQDRHGGLEARSARSPSSTR